MRTRPVLYVMALLVVSLLLTTPAMAAEANGTITGVGDTTITITGADGNAMTFSVAAGAKITLDGKEAKLAELKAGQSAKVTFDSDEENLTDVASAISATSPPEEPETE